MPRRPDSRPENALMVALVLVGAALLAALVLLMVGVLREDGSPRIAWYGAALVAAAVAAAVLILLRMRKLRRQHRPQWLETQGWHQGLVEQVRKGHARESTEPGEPGSGPGTDRRG